MRVHRNALAQAERLNNTVKMTGQLRCRMMAQPRTILAPFAKRRFGWADRYLMKTKSSRIRKATIVCLGRGSQPVAYLAAILAVAAIAASTPWACRIADSRQAPPQKAVADVNRVVSGEADFHSVILEGTTIPVAETEINFKYPGIIKDVLVKKGDHVKAGQLLITQDDAEDQVELKADQSLAASDAGIKSAEAALKGREADLKSKKADREAKQLEYDRVLKILTDGGSNNWEVDKAKDELESAAAAVDAANGMIQSAQADIDKAKLEKEQAGYKAQHQEEHLKQMRRTAPADAIVQAVNVVPGDSADPNKTTAVVLEQIDVLEVECHLPAVEAELLQPGTKNPR